jgi:Ca2+/Na+ antiporter
MESFLFQKKIDTNIETDNLLYNIINSREPKDIFLYGVIIIIGIFISINLFFNYNILVGLLFCSLIIYYLYTYNKYNVLNREKIDNEKFNLLYSKNQILKKYPDIVDFLYYIENFKSNNIQQYENLVILFEDFVKFYEYCIINNDLIFKFYKTLFIQKLNILSNINSFNFTLKENQYQNILLKHKIEAEKLLDKFLNFLVILYKKKIYYEGYSSTKNKIIESNVLPYNIFYESDYKYRNIEYNIANLIT